MNNTLLNIVRVFFVFSAFAISFSFASCGNNPVIYDEPEMPNSDSAELLLSECNFDIRQLMALKAHPKSGFTQGLAVHNNKAFVFYTYGYCYIVDLTSRIILCKSQLASQAQNNHVNCAMFSKFYYDEKDNYPLLYISPYGTQTCYVERYLEDDNSFELIQTINVETTQYANDYGEFLVDEKKGLLYDITFNGTKSNCCNIKIFSLPNFKDSIVTLTDINLLDIKKIELNVVNVLQGGMIYNGNILLVFGNNSTLTPKELYVINTNDFSVENHILPDSFSSEPEDIDVYGNSIIMCTNFPLGLWNIYNF